MQSKHKRRGRDLIELLVSDWNVGVVWENFKNSVARSSGGVWSYDGDSASLDSDGEVVRIGLLWKLDESPVVMMSYAKFREFMKDFDNFRQGGEDFEKTYY